MSWWKCAIINLDVCNSIIGDLNALESAIEDICGADTIAKIKERKEKIKETKG